MDDMISVIVPVYKVEPYLRKCLDSIVNQTYRDLQIILVDDGSPDGCGAICDEYAARDGRVQVIHKLNGGLSSARNAGLDTAKGEYIGFVDSDDWIEPDMYAYLLEGARRENAEIVVCGLWEQFPDYEKQTAPTPGTYDSVQALALLLADREIKPHVCDKLWKRALFDHISFPEQHIYEDVATSYRLFEKANKIVCLREAKYHYLQRSGSILDNRDLKQKLDFYNASVKLYNDLAGKYPELVPLMDTQRIKAITGVWSCLLHTRREDRKDVMPLVKEMAAFSRKHYDSALCAESMGLAGRVAAGFTRYASMWSFAAASMCSLAYKLRRGHWL